RAQTKELVLREGVDALTDVRKVRILRRDRRKRRHFGITAPRGELRSVAVTEREGREVDRGLVERLFVRRAGEVAKEAFRRARTDRRRRAAHEETKLAPRDLIRRSAARRGDLLVPVQPLAPIVAVLEALGRHVRSVLRELDVIVRIDERRRDDAR